jgi:prefoldin subunit 5
MQFSILLTLLTLTSAAPVPAPVGLGKGLLIGAGVGVGAYVTAKAIGNYQDRVRRYDDGIRMRDARINDLQQYIMSQQNANGGTSTSTTTAT